jgi:hypothetical protein
MYQAYAHRDYGTWCSIENVKKKIDMNNKNNTTAYLVGTAVTICTVAIITLNLAVIPVLFISRNT